MESKRRETDAEAGAADRDSVVRTDVTAHSTSGDRLVFIESGNTDGWIATDVTVDPDR